MAESPTVPNATFNDLSAEVDAFMARMAERYTPISIMVTIQLPKGVDDGNGGWWYRGNESAIYGMLRRLMLRIESEWQNEFRDAD